MGVAKKAGVGIAVLAAALAAAPALLYVAALAKLDGRPEPMSASPVEAVAAWRSCRESGPIRVQPLNPSGTVANRFLEHPGATAPGERAAWAVARNYNAAHSLGGSWWHPSGAALTIWITRNWSAEQLASTVAAGGFCRAAPNNSSKPTPLRGAA